MAAKLKSLADETIVLTGATSGIGPVTAQGPERGARLVLAARGEEALQQLAAVRRLNPPAYTGAVMFLKQTRCRASL